MVMLAPFQQWCNRIFKMLRMNAAPELFHLQIHHPCSSQIQEENLKQTKAVISLIFHQQKRPGKTVVTLPRAVRRNVTLLLSQRIHQTKVVEPFSRAAAIRG